MEIKKLVFEEKMVIILVGGEKVTITLFQTVEEGCFKIGVDAPKNIIVDREEIYHQKKMKL